MDRPPLPKGHWYDDQPDPLHTKEDVEDLFRRVDELKAQREAIERANRN
jgi:hypothetical protein